MLTSLRPPWLEIYSTSCASLFSLLLDAKSPTTKMLSLHFSKVWYLFVRRFMSLKTVKRVLLFPVTLVITLLQIAFWLIIPLKPSNCLEFLQNGRNARDERRQMKWTDNLRFRRCVNSFSVSAQKWYSRAGHNADQNALWCQLPDQTLWHRENRATE